MLAMCRRRTSERGGELGRRGECRVIRIYASRQSHGDLLEQPAVAVGIAERGERAVAAILGIWAADAEPPKKVGVVRAVVHAAAVVEHLADRDAATEQLVAGGLYVGD